MEADRRTAAAGDPRRLDRCLAGLAENTASLWAPAAVPRRPAAGLSPLEFHREHVAASQPVVLTGLPADQWPCLRRWSDEYLLEAVGDAEVTVNVTSHGLGDYVDASGRFVKPLEERMRFRDFLPMLRPEADGPPPLGSPYPGGAPDPAGVPYLSQQNDSLRQEVPALMADIPAALPLGVAAFGNEPEAVNLWIGDGRSISSCHMDHYENLYMVVRGEKIFTLLPPSDAPFLCERKCEPMRFSRQSGALTPVPDEPSSPWVPWIPVDVAAPDLERFPSFARAHPLEVRVRPGEMLYLPAMWYHQVAQRGVTVAVNYWHDMQFGHQWIYQQFLRAAAGLEEPDCDDNGEEDAVGDFAA